MAPFGKEVTADECRARVAWEVDRALDLVNRGTIFARILAEAHVRAGQAYLELAQKKERAS